MNQEEQPQAQPEVVAATRFTPRGDTVQKQRWRARPLQIALATVLLAFSMAMWFLFTAKSVLFTLDPVDSELDIDGGLHITLGERYLMRSGDYEISVEAQGHYPLRQAVSIGTQDQQQFHYKLQRLPGKLSFNSTPEGARILVDEEPLGSTPLSDISVAAGEYELRVLAERYLPYRQPIEVTGMGQVESYELKLEPAWANIAISSTPIGASVYVDGEVVGVTPAMLEILQGDHQISLKLPRYRSWEQSLSVSAGVHQNLEPVVLQPADGVLHLSSVPSRASVTLNGEYQGQTPLTMDLSPGTEHRVAVFKAGHSNANRSLSLESEEQRHLQVRLKPRLGEVLVQVQPADARILIAGKAVGSGTQTLKLPAFEQTLEVALEGYRSHRQRFTPRQGLSQIIKVVLLTEAEARLADLKPEITSQAGQKLLLFTPGDFTMGASRREPGRRANEVLHPVSLTRMFYLSRREVSNAEYRQFRQDHNSGRVEGNSLDKDRQPAVMISWNEAALYCNWLSEKGKLPLFYQVENGQVVGFNVDSHGYRLPTEAEWAWAARSKGEELLKFAWGNKYPPQDVLENYADNSSAYITGRTVNGYDDGHIVSAPTGSFKPNHRGLYDLGGNVAEWAHDVYALPNSSGIAEVDPLGAQMGNNHVIRGASWTHGTVTELRFSFRDYGKDGRDDVGFRVARFTEEK
ncbi:MAG: PEGA domain-containing protein [Gammaproteobacteria bacterium]|nr:PEGA domain-containing protein [Gammaproteobacteria bacterium]